MASHRIAGYYVRTGRGFPVRSVCSAVVVLILCVWPSMSTTTMTTTTASVASEPGLDGHHHAVNTTGNGVVTANVLAFGAKGDGVSDDAAAIQHAVDTVTASGGVVYLPPGAYALSTAIVVTGASGVSIVGAGSHALSSKGVGTTLLPVAARNLTVARGSGMGHAPPTMITLVAFVGCDRCELHDVLLTHGSVASGAAASADAPERHHAASSMPASNNIRTAGNGEGSAVVVEGSFFTMLADLRFESVWGAVFVNASNTVTIRDTLVLGVSGPSGFAMSAAPAAPANESVVWIDIGAGVNTVRLDNVGLISGGIGVRMDSPQADPPGVSPGEPLFLLTNDLEIDFPRLDAVALVRGRVASFVNAYIQGSLSGAGVRIFPTWDKEVQITNSRISGHHQAGIAVEGGTQTLVSNTQVATNSMAGVGTYAGVEVGAGVSEFSFVGNAVGSFDGSAAPCNQRAGIAIAAGSSDNYIITANKLTGNQGGVGIIDGGTGASKVVSANLPAAKHAAKLWWS